MIGAMRPAVPLFLVTLLTVALYAFSFASETPQGILTGRVLSKQTGRPLGGVAVVVRPAKAEAPGLASRRTRADDEGRFRFRALPVGNYELEPQSQAHENKETPAVVREAATTDLEVRLPPQAPFLNLLVHQRACLPGELPRVEFHGFRQGEGLRLRLYAAELEALLPAWGSDLTKLLEPTSASSRPGDLPDLRARGIRMAREWRRPVRKRDAEGVFYETERIADVPPGLYLITAQGEATQAVGWFVVTDLALVTKTAGGTVLAYASHLKTGVPVPRAEVVFYREKKRLGSAVTDAQGLAEFRATTSSEDEVALFATKGNSVAFLRGSGDSGDEMRHRVFSYTDRPVYRPGHQVSLKGVVRLRQGNGYALPDVRVAEVWVKDPQDSEIYHASLPVNAYGSYAGTFPLPGEAQGGQYAITVEVAGEKHEDTFAVASYRKPEWSVEVKPNSDHYVRGDKASVGIRAQYYFGAPVVGGTVRYTLFRDRHWSWWDDDEAALGPEDVEEGVSGEVVDSGEITTDTAGAAQLTLPTSGQPDEEAGAEYVYRLEAEVSDLSERTASGSGSFRVSPGEYSLDVRPERSVAPPGEPTSVEVRLRTLDDQPAVGVAIQVSASTEHWEGNRARTEALGESTAVTGADGTARVPLSLKRTGLVVVRVQAKDPRGNTLVQSTDIWVTTDEGGDYGVRYPDLAVLLDRKQYQPGDTAQVLLNTSSAGGAVLLTVEAESVLERRVIPLKGKSTVVRIPVRAAYTPNVFISACLVRDREFTSSEKRLVVKSDAHRLRVTVDADRKVYRPGDQATFRVRTTDAAGRPVQSEFSFGVVDEAIYAIRREPARGLWEAFYPVRVNRVDTSFSYPSIYLGDADKAGSNVAVRRNFPDTALWEPFLRTDERGTATVRLRLPDNLTTWRATAVAHSPATQIGKGVGSIRVMRELTLRLQAPRTFVEGDRARITAVAHNEASGPLDVRVALKAEGLTLSGAAEHQIRLQPGTAERVTWEGVVGPAGKVVLTGTATSGTLADGMELAVPVRAFERETAASWSGMVRDETAQQTVQKDPAAAGGELEVRLAPTLAGTLLGGLDYLTGYPYGCTEQTMSRFLPDVLVGRTLRELDLRQPKLEAELPAMTQAGLLRLARYQHGDGGWGWWQYDESDPWMTAYVVFGLQEARSAGIVINTRVYESGVGALESLFDGGKHSADDRMFAAWILARAGKKAAATKLLSDLEAGAAAVNGRPGRKLRYRSLGYAVLALVALGDDAGRTRAQQLMEGIWNDARKDDNGLGWEEHRAGWWDSGSQDGESAAVLLLAALSLNTEDSRAAEVVRRLLRTRHGAGWVSTRDTAWILMALTRYLKVSGELQPNGSVAVLVNGKEVHTEVLRPEGPVPEERVVRVPLNELADVNRLEVQVNGEARIYWTATLRQRLRMPAFPAESSAPGLSLKREYFRLETRRDENGRPVVLPERSPTTRFRVGDRILVRLTIRSDQPLEYLMVADPLPAGLEVQDRGDVEPWEWSVWWSSMDVRDDRVALFIRTLPAGERVIEYYARPEVAGRLKVLPAQLEDMYSPSTRANSADAALEVAP